MRRIGFTTLFLCAATIPGWDAVGGPVYIALGDSITFGETDLAYVPSFGDRGYVGLYADYLGARNGGVRPAVLNLAIDGETANSFQSGAGRLPPVAGRTDPILAAQNLNYLANPMMTQEQMFLATVASERALGNTITTVSITLGFNDLGELMGMSPTAIAAGLAAYESGYKSVLSEIRQQLPTANLLVLGYYNPFPADPTNPAAPTFNTYGMELNGIIRSLASQYSGTYVDTATPFLGHEAEYTYLDEYPHGAMSPPIGPYLGTEPIGDVHPNLQGYRAIASAIESAAVPEPSSLALMGVGIAATTAVSLLRHRRGVARD